MMDRRAAPRLRLMQLFLLATTSITCLHGNPAEDNHSLYCVNDYLFTINCTLSLTPSEMASDSRHSHRLIFTETYEKTTYECILKKNHGDYFCSVNTSQPVADDVDYPEIFTDTDTFEISLCRNGSETREVLDDEYAPFLNIKPNAPRRLAVRRNASQHHFTWSSSYEKYGLVTTLVDNLEYQLQYFERGDEHSSNGVTSHINTRQTNFSVDDDVFVPDVEYAARVRSSPNLAFFNGEWSDWSSEVRWKVESDLPPNISFSEVGKVIIPLCAFGALVILLCYVPVKKWKQNAFIPTPAPYFHTLYSDCQGDFKSWVITPENTADMLKEEASVQIDTLTKCPQAPEEDRQPQPQPQLHHQPTEGSAYSAYSNLVDPACEPSLLGIPYAVSTMAPPPAPGSSLKSLTLSSLPGSPDEGDSGCWLCSDTSLEKDSPWYCNEYCTLSAFQQTGPVAAEHHGSPSMKFRPREIIGADAIGEA